METVVNFTLAGILTGGVYALIGVGLALIFGVLRFINMAHGDLLAVGAYCSVVYAVVTGGGGAAGTLGAALVIVLVLGMLIQRTLIQPITREGRTDERRGLVLSLGLSMFLSNAILAVFGADYLKVPPLISGALQLGEVTVQYQRLLALVASTVLTGALLAFLQWTRLGTAIRATAVNPQAALASGIDIRRVHAIAFGIGSGLAAVAGALLVPIIYAMPSMGLPLTIKGLVIVILGGLGSIPGALIAALMLGIAESLAVLWLPGGFHDLLAPVSMLLVLLLRPSGLLGRNVTRF
ncbi:MAG TPA: branched-chain amino acid ABC transporter permease [Gemmatimonadales bacterium]|nr:branched-chain amino acid ABC transporter permease [Gemmatimonadales bacterium]